MRKTFKGSTASREPNLDSKNISGGWIEEDRFAFAVILPMPGYRPLRVDRSYTHRSPIHIPFEPWAELLRQAGELPSARQPVRCMIARHDGLLIWGVNVDKSIGPIAARASESEWGKAKIEPWPVRRRVSAVSAVTRLYLEPLNSALPLHTASETPDHPVSKLVDVLNDYPNVDTQIVIDLLPLTPSERKRFCASNLKTLGEDSPHRPLWEDSQYQADIQGVRVMVRVSSDDASECEEAAQRIAGIVEINWATDRNRMTPRVISDTDFDRVWFDGALEKTPPICHYPVFRSLLSPPSTKAHRHLLRHPNVPDLETFDPMSLESMRRLMPIGIVSEKGEDRLVGIPWGSNVDPGIEWTVGATGTGKSCNTYSAMLALAETGRGLLLLDPHRTSVPDLKRFMGRHADRILQLDMQVFSEEGALSPGWNPLDVTVVPENLKKARISILEDTLPAALFPEHFKRGAGAPQRAQVVRRALSSLLQLNCQLPSEIQANLLCIQDLLTDKAWRELVVDKLDARTQKWWNTTFATIAGSKGRQNPALNTTLNVLEEWRANNWVTATLGASVSTLRWWDIMEKQQIVLVALNNDESNTDKMVARLVVAEIVAAFKEREVGYAEENIQAFHVFLDKYQSYADVLPSQAETLVKQLRKYGAKVHFLEQTPSGWSGKALKAMIANWTHLRTGRLGSPKDAKLIAKEMGGGQPRIDPYRGVEEPEVTPGDLQDLPKYVFLCKVTQGNERSSAFKMRGIDPAKTWAHLMSDLSIDETVRENTGMIPVGERLAHADALPARIAHWLKTGKILDVDTALRGEFPVDIGDSRKEPDLQWVFPLPEELTVPL